MQGLVAVPRSAERLQLDNLQTRDTRRKFRRDGVKTETTDGKGLGEGEGKGKQRR